MRRAAGHAAGLLAGLAAVFRYPPTGRPRHLPDLRHGAGAGNARPGRWREPGADRLPPPLLVDAAAVVRRDDAGDVRPPSAVAVGRGADLDRARAHRARGALGRLAVPRTDRKSTRLNSSH